MAEVPTVHERKLEDTNAEPDVEKSLPESIIVDSAEDTVKEDGAEPFQKEVKPTLVPAKTKSQTSSIHSTTAPDDDDDDVKKPPPNATPPQDASPVATKARYTTFTRTQLHMLTILLGITTTTSPITANIYFPLLPMLRTQLRASTQAINMTLTIYIVFQALSPAIFGPLSDSLGRRAVFLFTLGVYLAGNLGLALNRHSYAALLVLQALQSLGASEAYAVSFGVVAYKSGGSAWVFWALAIVGVVLFLMMLMFLPETARLVVGNGEGRAGWTAGCGHC